MKLQILCLFWWLQNASLLQHKNCVISGTEQIHANWAIHLSEYCQAQFQLSPIWTEICIISDNYHPHPQDSSEQTT